MASASPNSRGRVAGDFLPRAGRDTEGDALSAALPSRRRAAGLTQARLGTLAGCLATSVSHAETGRARQSRRFWERADNILNADGEILRLYDTCRDTRPRAEPEPPVPACVMLAWTDGTITIARLPPGQASPAEIAARVAGLLTRDHGRDLSTPAPPGAG